MASKQPFKLFDLKSMAIKLGLRARNIIKYNILFHKKNILIIGDEESELYKQFT
jgi:hypothetical protein